MCLRKIDGGVGLRKMALQNSALGAKLSWKMYIEPQKLWCRLFCCKYLDSNDPKCILIVANTVRGSATWNFLWESKNIITEHVSWQIGNGKSALFWQDSWDGHLALMDSFDDHIWINMVESCIGSYVHDYFEDWADIGGLRIWKKLNIGNLSLCKLFWETINCRKIPFSNNEDTIFWCASKSEKYTIILGYEVQRQKWQLW